MHWLCYKILISLDVSVDCSSVVMTTTTTYLLSTCQKRTWKLLFALTTLLIMSVLKNAWTNLNFQWTFAMNIMYVFYVDT